MTFYECIKVILNLNEAFPSLKKKARGDLYKRCSDNFETVNKVKKRGISHEYE